jgi:hypothetical protein
MPIVPAPPTWNLFLTEEEARAIREALADYVRRTDITEQKLDAAWAVLAEVANRLRKEDSDGQATEVDGHSQGSQADHAGGNQSKASY